MLAWYWTFAGFVVGCALGIYFGLKIAGKLIAEKLRDSGMSKEAIYKYVLGRRKEDAKF